MSSNVNNNLVVSNNINDRTVSEILLEQSSNLHSNIVPSEANDTSTNMESNRGVQRNSTLSPFRFRDMIERQASERTRNWRDNLNNVIRPLVQQAQTVNNSNLLSSWMPTTASINSRQSNNIINESSDLILGSHRQGQDSSVIINFDESSINSGNIHPVTRPHFHNNYQLNSHFNQASGSNNSVEEFPQNVVTSNQRLNIDNSVITLNNINDDEPSVNRNQQNHHHNPQDNNEGPVTEAFAQIPEARAVLTTLNRYTPYVCILIIKSCYDHLDGILDILALFITFSHANWVIRQEITKQHQRKTLPLLRELLYIILVIAIIGFMLEKKNIFISLIFMSSLSEPFTLKNLLFSVGITDLILKLITVGIKIVITLLPSNILEYKGRGRVYLLVESFSQLYRALAPIQPWLVYLLDSYSGSEKIMGVLLSAAYMVAKGADLLNRAKFCKRSVIKLLQKVSFGVAPTKEKLQTAGGQCPICHDEYNGPVMLECNHIFCEACVGTWFDREQTCPLCRAKVVDDPSWRDGSTTFFVQFY